MQLIKMYSPLKDPKTTIVCTLMPVSEFDVKIKRLEAKLKKGQITEREFEKARNKLNDEKHHTRLRKINKEATRDRVTALVKAGMKIARINFSHVRDEIGRSNTEELMKIIREVSQQARKPVGIMIDLCGPRARIGNLKQSRRVEDDEEFTLTTCPNPPEEEIPVNKDTYLKFDEDIKPGELLLIDDGRIKCTIKKIEHCDGGARILCKAIVGGSIEANKGINVPKTHFSGTVVTKKDQDDLDRFVGLQDSDGEYLVDYVAQSFVRKHNDYDFIKELIEARRDKIPVIAKIETEEAVRDIDQIAQTYDCLMVARGDLGVNTSFDRVPQYQKEIIRTARKYNKPVIVATQMLEAMFYLHRHEPLRSEVTDIAVAVEEADGIMTSIETVGSENPGEIVTTMATIAHTIEEGRCVIEKFQGPEGLNEYDERYYSIAHAACQLAKSRNSPALVVSSFSGKGARALAYFRPPQPIITVTTQRKTALELLLYSNVYPVLIEQPKLNNTEDYIDMLMKILQYLGLKRHGEEVIAVFGMQAGKERRGARGPTNTIRLFTW